jgi:hypothetical protein
MPRLISRLRLSRVLRIVFGRAPRDSVVCVGTCAGELGTEGDVGGAGEAGVESHRFQNICNYKGEIEKEVHDTSSVSA